MMATARLFDALPDFGQRPRSQGGEPKPLPRDDGRGHQTDVAAIVRTEVERAEQAVEQRLTEAHQQALTQERERHDAAMAAQASELGERAGQVIAATLAELQTGLTDHVSAAVARIIGGILSDDLQKRSIESLAQSIRSAASDAEAMRIEVHGPQSLFEALAAAMPERAASFHFVEAVGFDLTVAIDGNLFETRLSEWSAALSDILT